MPLAPQTLLQNRYRIIQLIAQGGMGAVYQATDERLGHTVALKQTLVQDAELREAFEREARLLARLHHPVLPSVSDHFKEEHEQFLVMQFIPGEDLETRLERNGSFAVSEVLRWMDDLLDALDYLHTQQPAIIHRDIKPQNLKLTPRGEVVLLDFGLAKGSTAQRETHQSIFGYTPQYAPLEQIQGTGTDARTDLYALAATMYHLLTNTVPPDALTRASAILNGQPDPLRPLNTVNPAVPVAVASVLHQALAQRLDQRPTDAATMRAALQTATAPEATPSSSLNSSGKPTIMLSVPAKPTFPPALEQSSVAAPRPTQTGRRTACLIVGVGSLLLTVLLLATVIIFVVPQSRTTLAEHDSGHSSSTTDDGVVSTIGLSRAEPIPFMQVGGTPDWEFQVLEIVRGREAWNRLYEANQFNDQLPETMEYVLVKLRVVANFSRREDRDLYLQVTGSRLRETPSQGVPPEPELQTELSGRNQSEGWIAFPVGKDDDKLILKIEELSSSDDTNQRFLALEEGATVVVDPSLREIEPTNIGTEPREPAAYGQTTTSEDWEVTVREVVWGDAAEELVQTANQFNKPPEEGMQYVAVKLDLRYIGTLDQANRIFSYNFVLLDAEQQPYDAPSVVKPEPSLEVNLYPGGSIEGWIIMQAPRNTEEAVLQFVPDIVTNEINIRYLALNE